MMKNGKIWRILLTAPILLLLLGLAACGSQLFQTLFKEQEWSENYALAEEVKCTAWEMIDGDVDTAGSTVFPERVQGRTVFGAIPSAEAEVILPEKKSIHKIVIRSENLDSFKILVSIGDRDEWKLIKEFDNNTEKEIVIRTSVLTDKIKVRARGKTIHTGSGERAVVSGRVVTLRNIEIVEPEIQEIELYGFK